MTIAETKRLFIEEAITGNASFFYQLLNSPGWLMHIGERNIKSENDAKFYIADRIIKSYNSNGFGLYVMKLKTTREPVGICGFVKRDYLPAADLGFTILPQYMRNGYTHEAAESLLEYGFKKFSFREIMAVTSQSNDISQKLLLKLGFMRENDIQPDKNQPPLALFSIKEKRS